MHLLPSTIRHHVGALALCLDWVERREDLAPPSNPLRKLPKRIIFLDKTKNGDMRQVPISSVVVEALTNYIPKPEWGCDLFPWASEKNPRPTPKQVTGKLSEKFSRMFKAAGCEKFTFHNLRHEAISWLYERTNLSNVKITQILGSHSLKMALRYANLRTSILSDSLW